MLSVMGGQLVIAGCHSNVLYDVFCTSTLQLHIKGVASNTQSTKKTKSTTVAAFSLVSVNVSMCTEVIVCNVTLSEGSCKWCHHERWHHSHPRYCILDCFCTLGGVLAPSSSSFIVSQEYDAAGGTRARFTSAQVYCWWIIYTQKFIIIY